MNFFLKIIALFCACWAVAMTPRIAAGAEWRRVEWRGEPAWSSWHRGWVATVSERRGRLVYLGRGAEVDNLLYALPGLPATLDANDPPSWGGHRFWLGPQSAWQPGWPPPVEWEFSPAVAVGVRRSTLELQMPRPNVSLPRITRCYRWEGGDLVCEARWAGGAKPYCAIHILAVPLATHVEVKVAPSDALPNGFALLPVWRRPGVRREFKLPVPDIEVAAGKVSVCFKRGRQKIGLPAAALHCASAKGRLTISRAGELAGNLPDDGLVTQVYVGTGKEPYIELEELSAMVREGSFAVRLRPGAP